MSEIKINKYNKSITIVNDGIGFLEFGVADEILDLISNLQNQLQQKEKIIKQVREEVKEARLWNWTEQKILIDKFTKRLLEILDKEVN